MILNLKQLNVFIKYRRFHMHSLQTILPSIRTRDLLTSIDLKEAYLHVPVYPAHRKFLRFCSEGIHYQYKAMPFGLSSAPRTFTKLLDALTAHLRSHSIRLMAYLDDIIILSRSPGQAREDLSRTVRTLEDHGFTINLEKSQMVPATKLQHLGAIIDTMSGTVSLSPERQENIRRLVTELSRRSRVPLALLSKVLGTLVSAIGIVPWARHHIRSLQWFLLPAQRARISHSHRSIKLPRAVAKALQWWTTEAIQGGSPFRTQDRLILTTDASLYGWGAHLGRHMAQGIWTVEDLSPVNINFLELRAVFLALLAFAPIVKNRHILILTDNVATRAHLNHQGGTRSHRLMEETSRLFNWAETHLASLTAEHIAGVSNIKADWLSRATLDPSEWRLDPELFKQLTQRFGVPLVDLFATSQNAQLERFFTRFPDPRAEGTNALWAPWPPGLLYAFPPVNLVPRVVEKILQEKAEVLLIAPYWPRRPWFADLVALSVSPPWRIPDRSVSLSQGNLHHPDPQWLHLTGWHLKGTD
ncbi:CUE domain-containing protein 1 isoform X2 [Erythrolamprus reginae]|uniref:CUE domain-containing protein 1 isoform X2 n=1 Tax=Erythrolamprus reginae TaxID=121349 RepID=UPI00396CCF72